TAARRPRRTPNTEHRTIRDASLPFRGERSVAEADDAHLPLHRILAVDGAGIDGIERLPLNLVGELECDGLPFDGAGQFGFAELSGVVAGQLLALLLERHGR